MHPAAVAALAILGLVVLSKHPLRPSAAPSRVGSPAGRVSSSGGTFRAYIPGYGAVSTGPGGFNLLFDPRLFNLFGTGGSGTGLPDQPAALPGNLDTTLPGIAPDPIAPPSLPVDVLPLDNPLALPPDWTAPVVSPDPATMDLGIPVDATAFDPSLVTAF